MTFARICRVGPDETLVPRVHAAVAPTPLAVHDKVHDSALPGTAGKVPGAVVETGDAPDVATVPL